MKINKRENNVYVSCMFLWKETFSLTVKTVSEISSLSFTHTHSLMKENKLNICMYVCMYTLNGPLLSMVIKLLIVSDNKSTFITARRGMRRKDMRLFGKYPHDYSVDNNIYIYIY
jgi:hypothetical protein